MIQLSTKSPPDWNRLARGPKPGPPAPHDAPGQRRDRAEQLPPQPQGGSNASSRGTPRGALGREIVEHLVALRVRQQRTDDGEEKPGHRVFYIVEDGVRGQKVVARLSGERGSRPGGEIFEPGELA